MNKINAVKAGKRLGLLLVLVVLVMTAALTLSSCFHKRIPEAPDNAGQSVADKAAAIKPSQVIDMILSGARTALGSAQENTFSAEGEAFFAVSDDGGEISKFKLEIKAAFDLAADTNTADNVWLLELKKDENGTFKEVFSLYYKDSLSETPYLYAGVGGEKHAIKFFSLKNLAKKNGGNPLGEFGEWTAESLIGSLPLGEYTEFISLVVRNFLLDGAKSIFKNSYIKEDKSAAGFEVDTENLKSLIKIGAETLSGMDGISGTFDEIMSAAGVNLTFGGLMNAVNNLPETEIKIDAKFAADGALENLGASVKFLEDLNIGVDANDGSEIIDIEIEKGKKFSFALTKLNVTAGGAVIKNLPAYVDADEYVKHNLINFEITGTVRLENIVEITEDGEKIYGAAVNNEYAIEIRADLDPFALINGIGKDQIGDSIAKMGKFNLFVYSIGGTGSVTPFIEITFDPENSGDDCIYASVLLQGNAKMATEQTMKFDVSDLLEWIGLYGKASASGAAAKNAVASAAAASADGGESAGGLDLSFITNAIEFIKDSEFGPVAFALYPYKIDMLAGLGDFLVGNGGERMFFGFDGFSYGTVSPGIDMYKRIKDRCIFPLSVTFEGVPESNKLLTEYEYGQAFQNGWNTVDMMVTYNNKTAVSFVEQRGLKVIEMRGFDPYTPGTQRVTLFLITPPHSKIQSAAVYDTFADGGLPYGLIKIEYDITVAEPVETVEYAFASDEITAGSSIFNKQIKMTKTVGDQKTTLSTLFTADYFTLYKFSASAIDNKGAVSRAITADGIAADAGKYIVEVSVNGQIFTQVLYIDEVIFPDVAKKLVAGRPVSDLDAAVIYYDEEKGSLVKETVKATNGGGAKEYIDISGDVIKGNGKVYGQGMSDPTEIKYTYYVTEGGKKVERTRSYGYPKVIVEDAAEKFLQSEVKGRSFYAGSRITYLGSLLRSDGEGNTFIADTQNAGTAIVWNGKDKKYMILDERGNVIADEIKLTIHSGAAKGSSDVTDLYYDADTGRLKFPAEKLNGQNAPYGNASVKDLKVEYSAWYNGRKFEYNAGKKNDNANDAYVIFTLYQNVRTYSNPIAPSAISVKQGQMFPSGLFRLYITDTTSNVTARFDYKTGKYYTSVVNNKKIYLDIKVYEKGTQNEITDVIDGNGLVILPAGSYDMTVSAEINGILVTYDYTGKLTVNAPAALKAAKGARINVSGSYDFYSYSFITNMDGTNGCGGIINGGGKLDWTEARGYHITNSSAPAGYYAVTSIEVFDANGEKIENPFTDGYKVNLDAGNYNLSITYYNGVKYVKTTATLAVSE
ncbi:MAG: hypothetical protein LBP62_01450 [Clostridiales bacterium]|jgi:hypothetical protein|nr:hypothetical protein [Clostridiales bacterium]